MDRKTATNLGLIKYNTDLPCRNGHLADRYTKNGSCAECLRAINRRVKSNRVRQALGAPHSIEVEVLNAEHAAHVRQYAAQTWDQFKPAPDPDEKLRLLLEHVPAEHLRAMGYDIPEHLAAAAPRTHLAGLEADAEERRDALQGVVS